MKLLLKIALTPLCSSPPVSAVLTTPGSFHPCPTHCQIADSKGGLGGTQRGRREHYRILFLYLQEDGERLLWKGRHRECRGAQALEKAREVHPDLIFVLLALFSAPLIPDQLSNQVSKGGLVSLLLPLFTF